MSTEIEIPWDRWDESELEGDSAILPPGRHIVRVTGVSEPRDKSYWSVHYKVIGGDHPDAVGLTAAEMFAKSEEARKRLAILAKRMGWMRRGDGSKNPTINLADLAGEELIVETFVDEFENMRTGKKERRTKWTFAGFWPRAAGPDSGRRLEPAPGKGKDNGEQLAVAPSAAEEGF